MHERDVSRGRKGRWPAQNAPRLGSASRRGTANFPAPSELPPEDRSLARSRLSSRVAVPSEMPAATLPVSNERIAAQTTPERDERSRPTAGLTEVLACRRLRPPALRYLSSPSEPDQPSFPGPIPADHAATFPPKYSSNDLPQ